MKKIIFISAIFGFYTAQAQLLTSNELLLKPKISSFVDSAHHEVYRIRVENPHKMPDNMQLYTKLQSLSIFGNDWDSDFDRLDKSFYQLPNLQEFRVQNTDLNRLDKQIAEMPNLSHLDIMGNAFSALPPEIAACPKLHTLAIPNMAEVPYIPSLKSLEINFNRDTMLLPKGLEKYTNLEKLRFSGASAYFSGFLIRELLKNLSSLKHFSFDNPYIEEKNAVSEMISAIHQNKQLQELKLTTLTIDSESVLYLANIRKLETNYVECLDDESGKQCFEAIGKLPELKEFSCYYSDNQYENYGFIPNLGLTMDNWSDDSPKVAADVEKLSKLPNLKKLTMTRISYNLVLLKSLEELDLSLAASLGIVADLFKSLGKLPMLKKLTISADEIDAFPPTVQNLSALEEMVIYGFWQGENDASVENAKEELRKMLPKCKFTFVD